MTFDGPRLDVHVDADGALALDGEIDAYTAPELEASLAGLPDRCVIDLAAVRFIDSSGLRVIVEAHTHRRDRGGGITLRSPSPSVERLLEISGVAGHLVVEP
ncbi:MAG: STAS domain-containing protein [Desertimonas sp.]